MPISKKRFAYLSSEDKSSNARNTEWALNVDTLTRTLAKIEMLDPALGGKWQEGMIRYYKSRIHEAMGRKPSTE